MASNPNILVSTSFTISPCVEDAFSEKENIEQVVSAVVLPDFHCCFYHHRSSSHITIVDTITTIIIVNLYLLQVLLVEAI